MLNLVFSQVVFSITKLSIYDALIKTIFKFLNEFLEKNLKKHKKRKKRFLESLFFTRDTKILKFKIRL